MKRNLNSLLVSAALTTLAAGANAQISDGIIKIGVMNDMSGVYADVAAHASDTPAKMAIEDYGAAAKRMKVEVV